MKKLLMVAAVASLAWGAMAAEDNFQLLYWQVLGDKVQEGVAEYNQATLYAQFNGDAVVTLSQTDIAGGGASFDWDESSGGGNGHLTSFDLVAPMDDTKWMANYKGYNFWAELSYDGNVVGTTGVYSYDQLANYFSTWNSATGDVPVATVWQPSFMIPEPTSGLLFLIGCAGLALRRKRA